MKPLLFLILPLLMQCSGMPAKTEAVKVIHDEHRLVSRQEFHDYTWTASEAPVSWQFNNPTLSLTWKNGQQAFITALNSRTFKLTTPGSLAGPKVNLPGQSSNFTVTCQESKDLITLKTDETAFILNFKTLGWTLNKGEVTVLSSAGLKNYRKSSQWSLLWNQDSIITGCGYSGKEIIKNEQSIKFWNDKPGNTEETAQVSVPWILINAPEGPSGVFLNNSGQTYAQLTTPEGYIGSLEGGQEVYLTTGPSIKNLLDTFSQISGRPYLPPAWAQETRLVHTNLSNEFWKKAHLSVLVDTEAQDLGPVISPVIWDVPVSHDGSNYPFSLASNLIPYWALENTIKTAEDQNPEKRPWVTVQSGWAGSSAFGGLEIPHTLGREDLSETQKILSGGLSGLNNFQIRLNVSSLDITKDSEWNSLALWALSPAVVLDCGKDALGWWTNLGPTGQKKFEDIISQRTIFLNNFYTLGHLSSKTGLPLWRALGLDYPQDKTAWNTQDEFLLGSSLLAAPIYDSKTNSRKVYLPGPGVWFDFYSGEEFGGGKTYQIEAKPGRLPLFAKGGGIVPLKDTKNYQIQEGFTPVTVHIWPGAFGKLQHYWDDGVTFTGLNNNFAVNEITYTFDNKTMRIEQKSLSAQGKIRAPYLLYRLHNVYKPNKVSLNRQVIPLYGDSYGVIDSDQAAAWYENNHTLLIKVLRPENEQTLDIQFD